MGNQNSGPRPRPTALKLLAGVTRKDRINQAEPVPPAGQVEMPVELSPLAQVVWAELAPVCLHMGTLTPADVQAFWTLCDLQATFRENSLRRGSEAFDVRLERETANVLRPFYEYFGLTPSSRARIAVKKPKDEPTSKWAGALK